MSKIQLTDTSVDIFQKMSEGNPGALAALMNIYKESPIIDPQSAMGGLGPILSLDTLGVYGSDIYILWSDQCHKDTREFLMLLRANQLGFVSNDKIVANAKDQRREVKFTQEEMEVLKTRKEALLARIDSWADYVPPDPNLPTGPSADAAVEPIR